MIGTAARIRRALGCIAGAAIAGIPVELLFLQVWRMNIDVFRNELPVLIALPLAAGLGTALGLEVAAVLPPQATEQTSAWDRTIDVASLILLGILCGGLVAALVFGRAPDVAVEAAITLALLAFGIAAARTLTRWGVHDAKTKRLAPFCAILSLLYSLSTVAGTTLVFAITYQPCRPGAWCIDPPTPQSFMLTFSIFLGLPLGLWLAAALWLALILGRHTARIVDARDNHETPAMSRG